VDLIHRRLFVIVRGLVSLLLLLYLISIIEWHRLASILSEIEIGFLFIAPVLLLVGLFFSAIRWKHLLASLKIHQTIKNLYVYYLMGNFYSIFLPGVIGGDIIRVGFCASETKSSISVITTSVIVERLCGILVLFIIAAAVVFLLPSEILSSLGGTFIIIIVAGTCIGLIILIAIPLVFRELLGNYLEKEKTNKLMNRFSQILNMVTRLPFFTLISLFVFSALFQAADIFSSFIIARALNIDVPLLLFFTIMPIVYICTILPISLGGLGVREGAFVYLLTKVGVLSSDAVTLSILIYFNRIIIGCIGGIIQISPGKIR